MNFSYAVNLIDLISLKEQAVPINMLLNQKEVLSQKVVDCEAKRIDGAALRVHADLDIKRWEAIVSLIRKGAGRLKGIPKHKLRIYKSKTGRGGWKRI